jgi:hypothetical protein
VGGIFIKYLPAYQGTLRVRRGRGAEVSAERKRIGKRREAERRGVREKRRGEDKKVKNSKEQERGGEEKGIREDEKNDILRRKLHNFAALLLR